MAPTPDFSRSSNATAEMLGLLSGYWYSQALYVLAELGIADRLATGPKTAEILADESRCDAASLYRFLRALASAGVLEEIAPRTFASTPLSETLRSDRPDSLRSVARLGGHPLHWQAWGRLLHSVRTGEPGFDAAHCRSFFDALAADPVLSEALHAGLARLDDADAEVVDALALGRFTRIVDVGGGTGALARRMAAAQPRASVILFDQPHVLAIAPAMPGVTLEAGSFHEGVPADAEAYVLKFVLHDWDDARAAAILRRCRAALHDGGRVFAIEVVVPDGAAPSIAKTHDVNMLVLTGGRERTLDEYRDLFARADLDLVRTTCTARGISVLETAAPA
jgi:O-methyltransferase/methyltransferase family protein